VSDLPRRVEQACSYPSELLDRYRRGKLFREWCAAYPDALLFCPRMWESRQIPHSGPIGGPMFFHELYLGVHGHDKVSACGQLKVSTPHVI
jgi:hypothetical protein